MMLLITRTGGENARFGRSAGDVESESDLVPGGAPLIGLNIKMNADRPTNQFKHRVTFDRQPRGLVNDPNK